MQIRKIIYGVVFVVSLVLMSSNVHAVTDLEPLIVNGEYIKHYGTENNVYVPTVYEEKDTEMRGVWVATVYNLNMPLHTSVTQYQAAYLALLDELEESNMNAILFQVRPQNDAFYDSNLAPYSRWLTGTEGVDPGWDVMSFMIDEAHKRGIEFHAWLNPYRVANTTETKDAYLATLDDNNFAKLHPELVIAGNLDSHNRYPYILNPGEPLVQDYIVDIIDELITNYDVDGIHFDDYFYPYSGISSDFGTYNTYKLTDQGIEDWRRENVNTVVRRVKGTIDLYNDTNNTDIKFGISPFGIWKNGAYADGAAISSATMESYYDQFADTKKWVEMGWLDYIAPQIYWSFQNSVAPYADMVDFWTQTVRGTDVDLLIGHAISSASIYSWDTEEIANQLLYNSQFPEITGEIMYSAAYLDYPHMELVESTQWLNTPLNTWQTSDVLKPAITIEGTLENDVYTSDVTLSLTSDNTIYYQLNGGEWTQYTSPLNFSLEGNYVLYAKAVDAFGEESLLVSTDFIIDKINSDIPIITVTGAQDSDSYLVCATVSITSSGTPIYVKINRGAPGVYEPYIGEFTLDEAGDYFIVAKTVSADLVESQETSMFINVKTNCYDAPILTINGDGNDPYYQNAQIIVSGSSPSIYVQIDNSTPILYSTPIDLTEGNHTITYWNDDECADSYMKVITVDNTPPIMPTFKVTGTYDGSKYYTSITTLDINKDSENDVVMYRVHNGETWTNWSVYSETLSFSYNTTFTIAAYTIDLAGNISETNEIILRLDIPPTEDNLYVIRDGQIVTYYGSTEPVELPTTYTEKDEEIRAVWVATVNNIDIGKYTSQEDYQTKINNMLNVLEQYHINVIFFQTRPLNDAFYQSEYAPYSRFLTGEEGKAPDFDVFAYLITEAHKRGIEVHAWLNPYRVTITSGDKQTLLDELSPNNFARMHPELVMQDNAGKLILNPGEPQVQAYIKNVILELLALYDVDGIHFDDYFYSYNGMSDSEDANAYSKYGEGLSLADWRRKNIDTIISDIHDIVTQYNESQNDTVKFGVSPFGIWQSGGVEGSNTSTSTLQSYSDQYADTKKWVEMGWLDYILPQLYWEFNHSLAPFADLVDWWANLTETNSVDLIIGQGLYRYDDDTWEDDDELLEQIRYMSQYNSIIGSALFSYRSLLSVDPENIEALDRLTSYYWTKYASFPWESDVTVQIICDDGYHEVDGECVVDEITLTCDAGYHEENGECIIDESVITCSIGYELVNDECVLIDEKANTGCFSSLNLYNELVTSFIVLTGFAFIYIRKQKW